MSFINEGIINQQKETPSQDEVYLKVGEGIEIQPNLPNPNRISTPFGFEKRLQLIG